MRVVGEVGVMLFSGSALLLYNFFVLISFLYMFWRVVITKSWLSHAP